MSGSTARRSSRRPLLGHRHADRVRRRWCATISRSGLNHTRVVDFQLNPAAREETVTVTAPRRRSTPTNAEIKGSLTARADHGQADAQPGQLPVAGRDLPRLPGESDVGQNNPTASSGSSINFNGTGTRGATFQINGVNNDDSSENQTSAGRGAVDDQGIPGAEATASAPSSAAATARVVLVQTKSGTNQWRGDVYEYHQDSDDLNAKRSFALVEARRTSGISTAARPASRSSRTGCSRSSASIGRGSTATQNFARDILLAERAYARG